MHCFFSCWILLAALEILCSICSSDGQRQWFNLMPPPLNRFASAFLDFFFFSFLKRTTWGFLEILPSVFTYCLNFRKAIRGWLEEFWTAPRGHQISCSLENYAGSHSGTPWTPYDGMTALTGASFQCKQLHLKLIGCLKSISNELKIMRHWHPPRRIAGVSRGVFSGLRINTVIIFILLFKFAEEVIADHVTTFYFLQSIGLALWMLYFLCRSIWTEANWGYSAPALTVFFFFSVIKCVFFPPSSNV